MVTSDGSSCWTDEFVLSHCVGYRVEDELGWHLGFVEAILDADEAFGSADALVIRPREATGHGVVVPIDEIVAVEPTAELVVVRAGSKTDVGGAA